MRERERDNDFAIVFDEASHQTVAKSSFTNIPIR